MTDRFCDGLSGVFKIIATCHAGLSGVNFVVREKYDKIMSIVSAFIKKHDVDWKLIGAGAAVLGIVSAVMALVMPQRCSLHNISSDVELWLLLGIFVMQKINDRTKLTKMVFMLTAGSHLLASVIIGIFGGGGLIYLFDWLPVMVLCVPAAYFGFLSKYGGIEYAVTYSAVSVIFIVKGLYHLRVFVRHIPLQFIAVVICFTAAGVIIYKIVTLNNYWKYCVPVFGAAFLLFGVLALRHSFDYKCTVLLPGKYPLDSSWSAKTDNEKVSTAEIVSHDDDSASLEMTFYEPDENTVTLTDGGGREYELLISCSDDFDVKAVDK